MNYSKHRGVKDNEREIEYEKAKANGLPLQMEHIFSSFYHKHI